jgi:manganese/iron transport system ATP-binding protein
VASPDLLSCTQLAVGYRGRAVLTGVDFSVPAGTTLALAGPNGAGKSTLIKAVLGLAEAVSGTLTVRARPAYVPQAAELDPDFPVSAAGVVLMGRYRTIGWWRPTGRADRQAARAALEQVGLGDRAGIRFGLLSGGQRQRVLLARAIAAESSLLLLDEPFNGVDATSQEAIVQALVGLTAAGAGVVLSTHDLSLAGRIADQVALLNGRQWAVGAPQATLTTELLRRTYGGWQ